VRCFVWLAGLNDTSVTGEAMAKTDNLAQASRTRLSESSGGSPKPFSPKVTQAANSLFWASKQLAQAKGVSPKRDPTLFSVPVLSPRLGERGTRLSETVSPERGAGRDNMWFGYLVAFVWLVMVWVCLLGWDIHIHTYIHIYIMDCHVCVTKFMKCMMDIMETWHVKLMSELEFTRHGNDMRWGLILMGW